MIAAWAVWRADGGGRMFTGTLAPEDWQARRQKMRDLRRLLVRRGYGWECAWVTERGAGGLLHVHAVQHGTDVPEIELAATWGARVELARLRDVDAGTNYLIKEMRAGSIRQEEYLALNGDRALHWTSGFFHGRTKSDAHAAMRSEVSGGRSRLTWHKEPGSVHRLDV